MKIVNKNKNMIIYINKQELPDINIKNKIDLELYFKSLFLKLKDYYNIKLTGSYDITVYQDDYYGIVIELIKNNSDYYEYFDNQIDMCILIKDKNPFLYKLDDYFALNDKIINNAKMFYYNDNIYLELTNNISTRDYNVLIEHSDDIIFNSSGIIKKLKDINI